MSSLATWSGNTTRPTSLAENVNAGLAVAGLTPELTCATVKSPIFTVSPRCQPASFAISAVATISCVRCRDRPCGRRHRHPVLSEVLTVNAADGRNFVSRLRCSGAPFRSTRAGPGRGRARSPPWSPGAAARAPWSSLPMRRLTGSCNTGTGGSTHWRLSDRPERPTACAERRPTAPMATPPTSPIRRITVR